jgi:hypothetical protein
MRDVPDVPSIRIVDCVDDAKDCAVRQALVVSTAYFLSGAVCQPWHSQHQSNQEIPFQIHSQTLYPDASDLRA